MEQVKQFDFNESSIFGKFDLFCKRLQKLIELFTTVHQFSSLAKHNIEVSQIVHVACCMLHSPSVLEPRKAQQSGREVTPCNVVRCMLHGMPHVERRVRSYRMSFIATLLHFELHCCASRAAGHECAACEFP
jgi:hypothetical protein